MNDTTAKIRELLPKTIKELENFTLRKSKEALALLDAERPSVPMAMLEEIEHLDFMNMSDDTTDQIKEIVTRYGFAIDEPQAPEAKETP